MDQLSDLITPTLAQTSPTAGRLLPGTVLDTGPARVIVPLLDGGHTAYLAFGAPATIAEGDEVRVMVDDLGGIVIVAWEPA